MSIKNKIFIMNCRAAQMLQHGMYQDAMQQAAHALKLCERHLRDSDQLMAASCYNVAECHFRNRAYELARENHARALQIRRRLPPKMQDDVAQSLNALAACHVELGNRDDAERCFIEALRIRVGSLGEDHFLTGVVYLNMGDFYSNIDDFAEAKESYLKALHIFQAGESPQTLAICLNDLALLHQRNKMYKQAVDYYNEAVEKYESYGPPAYYDLSITLKNLGDLQQSILQYDQAISSFSRSIELGKNFHRKDHPEIVEGTLRLAHLFRYLGLYDEAEGRYLRLLSKIKKSAGDEGNYVALCLGGLAEIHRLRGEYREAHPLYLEALEQVVNKGSGKNTVEGQLLNDLGTFYYGVSKNKEAAEVLVKAGDIFAAADGRDSDSYAQTLCNLGTVATSEKQFEKAESFFNEALDVTGRCLGKNHPSYALSLQNLGVLFRDLGRYSEAEVAFRQAILILTSTLGRWHPHIAVAYQNLGDVRRECGSYLSAEKLFRLSLKIRLKIFGDSHPEVSHALHGLAGVYGAKGDHQEEKNLLMKALNIKEGFDVENESKATTLSNLGLCCSNLGEFDEAEEYLVRSLEIRRHLFGERHPEVAYSLRHLGSLYGKLADTDTTAKYLIQSYDIMLEFYGNESMHSIIALECLADFMASDGPGEAVFSLYERILQKKCKILSPDDIEVSRTLLDIANSLVRLGRYSEAKAKLEQSRAIMEGCLGRSHPDFAAVLYAFAQLALLCSDYEEAEGALVEASSVVEKAFGNRHPSFGSCLFGRGLIEVAQGRNGEALRYFGLACDIDSDILGLVFRIGSDRRRMLFLESIRPHMESYLSLVSRSSERNDPAFQKAFDLVLQRKGMVTEAMAEQRLALLSGRYPELAGNLRICEDTRQAIIGLSLAPADPEGAESRTEDIARLREKYEAVEAALARKIPEVSLDRWLRHGDLRGIARHLPANSVLVEYFRVGWWDYRAGGPKSGWQWECDHYLAFVLKGDGKDDLHITDLGGADEIDQVLIDFRNSVTGRDVDDGDAGDRYLIPRPETRTSRWAEYGERLRSLIFDPLLPTLGSCDRLYLAPDGELTRLPFEALPLQGGGHLIDRYLISYLSSGRDLLRLQMPSTAEATEPYIAADPDFDLGGENNSITTAKAATVSTRDELRRAGFPLAQLSGARKEGIRIADLLRVRPRLGGEVLESEVKGLCSPRILHMATHGVFLPDRGHKPRTQAEISLSLVREDRFQHLSSLDNPLLRSFLALAGANTWLQGRVIPDAAEDGLLTAEDVSGLDLTGTEMAVLSACDTALGTVHAGEGVFGLRRAFTLAGARTLVMSQWKIPDEETRELMETFYCGLLAGKGRAEALREAQLAVKRRKNHPRYWGAFICQGDPGPLNMHPDATTRC